MSIWSILCHGPQRGKQGCENRWREAYSQLSSFVQCPGEARMIASMHFLAHLHGTYDRGNLLQAFRCTPQHALGLG